MEQRHARWLGDARLHLIVDWATHDFASASVPMPPSPSARVLLSACGLCREILFIFSRLDDLQVGLEAVVGSLASRKHCDFENAEALRFHSVALKNRSDVPAIFLRFSAAIFSCDFCSTTCDFALCDFALCVRFENAAVFLRLRFFGC